tara:strand:- start:9 stop:404 length:396 start_codon:yes stop_codon:yes gene_type:complete
MINEEINYLKDLNHLRSAPILNQVQRKNLLNELYKYMNRSDWFTMGIMADSKESGIIILREIEKFFKWNPMKIVSQPANAGPIFLKANQKTGDVHIRIEFGLGEGILITCQHDEENKSSETLGPFPLDFFK